MKIDVTDVRVVPLWAVMSERSGRDGRSSAALASVVAQTE